MTHTASFSFRFLASNILGAFCAWATTQGAFASTAVIVGQVTLVIGHASVRLPDGSGQPLQRGISIRVGDRIETQAGGHVHLKFVDGGLLSVRPASRLFIESYSYSAQYPEQGAIKFRLDEGVVRSITGTWGEAARDRFRLNTPMAAIGVKGTDFIVGANPDKTAATVYTGAIMLSPLTGACLTSVGPCATGNEKVLSEDMRGLMVELGRQQVTPQLVAVADAAAGGSRGAPTQQSGSVRATAAARDTSTALSMSDHPGAVDKTIVSENRAVTTVVQGAMVPAIPKPTVSDLIWERFTWAPILQTDDLTHAFDTARTEGRERLAGNANYTLSRTTQESFDASQLPQDAVVNFRLASGVAAYLPSGSSAAQVANIQQGSLSVDFSRASYATKLDVTSSATGLESIAVQGSIKSNGTFITQQGNTLLTGGFSAKGQEAGYSFDKLLPGGLLYGLTLWGR